MSQLILSGMQVIGRLHLGNYLGAMKSWIELQDQYNCLFFLANLHSITIHQDPVELKNNTIYNAALYLACGLDSKKTTIFVQSQVKEHSELSWILNCTTPLGWLKRMTQFKDKSSRNQENINLGLLSYPVLMAADILLYNADKVPVGVDQKQHLELVRDIASMVNNRFDNKEIFKLPEPIIHNNTAKIMSLRDGTRKMSKSDNSEYSRIDLLDSPEIIQQKIQKAKTDSINYLSYDPISRPEISNLINIFSILSQKNIDIIINDYNNKGFSKFKNDLADLIINSLQNIKKDYQYYLSNLYHVQSVLEKGAEKAREIASTTINLVKNELGLL